MIFRLIFVLLPWRLGYVTHGTDRCLWAFRLPVLTPPQVDVARAWLNTIDEEVKKMKSSGSEYNSGENGDVRKVLTLYEDMSIGWTMDERWEEIMRLTKVLPGEE